MTRILASSGLVMDGLATALSFCGPSDYAHVTAWVVGGTLTTLPILYQGALILLEARDAPEVLRFDEAAR